MTTATTVFVVSTPVKTFYIFQFKHCNINVTQVIITTMMMIVTEKMNKKKIHKFSTNKILHQKEQPKNKPSSSEYMNRVHTHTHNKKQNDYNVSTLTTTTNYSKQNRTYCIISMSMKISLLVIFYHIIDVFIIFEYQKTIKPLTV